MPPIRYAAATNRVLGLGLRFLPFLRRRGIFILGVLDLDFLLLFEFFDPERDPDLRRVFRPLEFFLFRLLDCLLPFLSLDLRLPLLREELRPRLPEPFLPPPLPDCAGATGGVS